MLILYKNLRVRQKCQELAKKFPGTVKEGLLEEFGEVGFGDDTEDGVAVGG